MHDMLLKIFSVFREIRLHEFSDDQRHNSESVGHEDPALPARVQQILPFPGDFFGFQQIGIVENGKRNHHKRVKISPAVAEPDPGKLFPQRPASGKRAEMFFKIPGRQVGSYNFV